MSTPMAKIGWGTPTLVTITLGIIIHDFLVLRGYRNRFIGKKLLQEVENIAKKMHCCKITLEVQEKNTSARRLYDSFGFKHSFLDTEAGDQLFFTKEL
ncbi:MAG: GNAT family N-acetyltransferase [Desulfobacteraceae bacterium]|nr:GNAT family N-acetyltransferase [Desulfobacteraceae bacterium]